MLMRDRILRNVRISLGLGFAVVVALTLFVAITTRSFTHVYASFIAGIILLLFFLAVAVIRWLVQGLFARKRLARMQLKRRMGGPDS